MIINLDEAIQHGLEVAEKNEKIADTFEYSLKTKLDCKKCASEHRQLTEWLRELKAYREAEEEIDRKRKSGQWSDAMVFGMNMAFFIMRNHIREVNVYE